MKDGIREKIIRIITLGLIAVIVIVGAVFVYPTYRRGKNLKLQEVELRRQIEAQKKEIERLRENQRRFRTDPDFVEIIARQNSRVYPGELVYIFED